MNALAAEVHVLADGADAFGHGRRRIQGVAVLFEVRHLQPVGAKRDVFNRVFEAVFVRGE